MGCNCKKGHGKKKHHSSHKKSEKQDQKKQDQKQDQKKQDPDQQKAAEKLAYENHLLNHFKRCNCCPECNYDKSHGKQSCNCPCLDCKRKSN